MTDELLGDLRIHKQREIGPIASPDVNQSDPGLLTTRSGKIMRWVLRKIEVDDFENFGDFSTLAEPGVVDDLIVGKKCWKLKNIIA